MHRARRDPQTGAHGASRRLLPTSAATPCRRSRPRGWAGYGPWLGLAIAVAVGGCGPVAPPTASQSLSASQPEVASKQEFQTVLCGAINHVSAAMVPLAAAQTAEPSELPALLEDASRELAASMALLERGRNWRDGNPALEAVFAENLPRLNGAFWGADVPAYRSASTVGKVVEASALYALHVTELYSQSLSGSAGTKREAAEAFDLASVAISSGILLLVAGELGLRVAIRWGEEIGYQLPCTAGG